MAAKGGDKVGTLRNPAIGQLGCDALNVKGYAAVLHLPAAVAFGEDRVTGARVAVLGQPGRSDVNQHSPFPNSNVGQVQVAKGDRRGALVAYEPRQRGIVGVGPEMFVVVERIGVYDQQLIFVFADAKREGEFAQPPEPPLAQIAPRPPDLRDFSARELLGSRESS